MYFRSLRQFLFQYIPYKKSNSAVLIISVQDNSIFILSEIF